MRPWAAWVLLAVAACSPPADTTPELPAATVPDGPIRGVLPDGTVYDVVLEPPRHEAVASVSAAVVVDGDVSEVAFRRDDEGWTTDPAFDVITHLGLPMVELPAGVEWAADDQFPMQVTYRTLGVRRGCGEAAVACNPTQAVQAIPLAGWQAEQVTVVSYALRRPDNPHYLDPGPLAGRSGHDLIWTGEEMIVWGGSGPPRVEGAAFHPGVGTWRLLPPAPLEDGQPTRAVWAGTEMVVMSPEATVVYDPDDDSWKRVAAGLEPPSEPGQIAWTGERVLAWTPGGIHSLRGGTWDALSDPGVERGRLLAAEGRLVVVGAGACPDRAVREWDGRDWEDLADPPESSGTCPDPNQTALLTDRIVMWEDETRPALVHEEGTWREAPPVPLESIDRPSGPLPMGSRFLVPRGPEGVLFDPAAEDWHEVVLPGHGTDTTMVWTGEEVLMWDRCCYEPDDVDAWRWTPPGGN